MSISERTLSLALLLCGILVIPALAGDLVELRDGRIVDAERVDVQGEYLVLHTARGKDGAKKQIRVRIADVQLRSAVSARANSIAESDAAGWLEFASLARGAGLFDEAEAAYARAALRSDVAANKLEAFRKARPAEESRHRFELACRLFRDGDEDGAREAARGAIDAKNDGPDALMASELLNLLAGSIDVLPGAAQSAQSAPSAAALRSARALRRLVTSSARSATRLRRARSGGLGSRLAAVRSVTRELDDLAARIAALHRKDMDAATRQSAATLMTGVQTRRVEGLLLLADLGATAGHTRSALAAVHEVLSIRPDEALALDLRERLLDGAAGEAAEDAAARRRLLASGSRILVHPYPYPARDNRSGLGLVPTWDPIRGLGRIPLTRPRGARDGNGAVVIVRPRRR